MKKTLPVEVLFVPGTFRVPCHHERVNPGYLRAEVILGLDLSTVTWTYSREIGKVAASTHVSGLR